MPNPKILDRPLDIQTSTFPLSCYPTSTVRWYNLQQQDTGTKDLDLRGTASLSEAIRDDPHTHKSRDTAAEKQGALHHTRRYA